ncbi:MAG: hypothetical protein Kow0077_18110 [Anaerolineae bacterium]
MVQMLDGVTIDGKYRLIEAVGKGGTSVVYRGQQLSLNNREVAVKVMSFDPGESPEYALRFRREAAIIATLEHPFILPIFDYGADNDRRLLYLVTPLMQNGSLKRRILENGPMPLAECIEVLEKIGSALQYAHENGVIHRDVNPRNILLSNFGNPMLSDFGLARVDGGLQITQPGHLAGTKAYMGPEQWVGEEIDHRCDIYSLGVSVYEMLAGVQPFRGETARELAIQHLQEPPPSLLEHVPQLPHAIERVVFKALAKHPDDRYQTVAAFVEAFKEAAQERPVGSVPPAARLHPPTPRADAPAVVPIPRNDQPEPEDGFTLTPRSELTEQLGTISLTFAVPREEIDSGRVLNVVAEALSAEFQELAIEVSSIRAGSTIISLTMLAAACSRLFEILKRQPDLFDPYPLIRVEFGRQVWHVRRRLGAFLRLVAAAAIVVLALMGAAVVAAGSGLFQPAPTPSPTARQQAAAIVASNTPQPTAIPSLIPLLTSTPTASLTPTASATGTATASATAIPTNTPRPTSTQPPPPSATPGQLWAGLLGAFAGMPDPGNFMAWVRLLQPIPTPYPALDGPRVLVMATSALPVIPTSTPSSTPRMTSTPTLAHSSGSPPTGGPPPSGSTATPVPPTSPPQPTSTPVPPTTPPEPTATPVPPTTPPEPTATPVPPTTPPEPTATPRRECGNGVCEPGENKNKCPEDCPDPADGAASQNN